MPAQTILLNEDTGLWDSTPTYLFDYAEQYRESPKNAALQWFHAAHFGLGVSYGLFSLLGRGADPLGRTSAPLALADYEKLKEGFTARHFNATELVEFAIANGMRYLEFTVRTADGFCLYNSQVSDFTSVKATAKRDLLGELASVCEYHGIGLCLRYSHGRDWRHPHSPTSKAPAEGGADIEQYNAFIHDQLHELLTQYGPIAAICLDGIEDAQTVGESFPDIDDLYRMIHFLQPQTLVCYQQGLTGEEDFFSAVDQLPSDADAPEKQGHILRQLDKPRQIRASMTPGEWGYHAEYDSQRHLSQDDIWQRLENAGAANCSLLLNTSLLPDGGIDARDLEPMLDAGQRISRRGFPGIH
ncbi:MAG: alpha-L-fucosidase [Victivallales bacterium]|nr:alpha-L-fucosidase [Victivallales bacterium]